MCCESRRLAASTASSSGTTLARRRELRSRTAGRALRTTLAKARSGRSSKTRRPINSVGSDRPRCRHDRRLRRPGGTFTFYEIDGPPLRGSLGIAVFHVHTRFGGSGSDCDRRRRLKIAAAANRSYDLSCSTTFSSDSRPCILLTREAVELYLRSCAPTVCSPSTSRTTTSTSSRSSAASLGHSADCARQDYVPASEQARKGASVRPGSSCAATNARSRRCRRPALGETRPEARPARLDGSVSRTSSAS